MGVTNNIGCQSLAAKHFKQKDRNPALSQQNELELHKAVSSDDIKRVQELIADGVNVNSTNKTGQSPLDLVSQIILRGGDIARRGNAIKIALALIKAGAKVSKTNKLHGHLLVKVIQADRFTISSQPRETLALALIEAGADVDARDVRDSANALHWAHKNLKIALALIKAGANVNARDDKGQTPIFWMSSNLEGTLALIKAGAEVNVMDKEGNTPLSDALQYYNFDHSTVTNYLIAAGANVHNEAVMKALRQHLLLRYGGVGGGPRTDNLLHVFSQYGFVEAVKACINAGYDVNARYKLNNGTEYGPTPLQGLAENTDMAMYVPQEYRDLPFLQDYLHPKEVKHIEEIASILIEAGADINLSNNAGDTPLVLAIESGYTSLALMLIEAGARLNWDSYDSPLNTAIKYNITLALTLIEAGAEVKKLRIDINDEVAEGGTLLHYAADGNFVKAAEILIAAGANASIKNSDGNIPFCMAYKKDHTEAAEIIRPEGFGKTFQWFKCL